MDQRNNHLGGMGYDHMSYNSSPQFSNPWNAGSTTTNHAPSLFPNSMASSNTGFDALAKQNAARATTTASLPYSSISASAPSLSAGSYPSYGSSQLLDMSSDLLNQPRTSTYEQGYSAAPSTISTYAPASAPYVNTYGSVAQPQQQDEVRRLSHS